MFCIPAATSALTAAPAPTEVPQIVVSPVVETINKKTGISFIEFLLG